jgi:hypothetical protein
VRRFQWWIFGETLLVVGLMLGNMGKCSIFRQGGLLEKKKKESSVREGTNGSLGNVGLRCNIRPLNTPSAFVVLPKYPHETHLRRFGFDIFVLHMHVRMSRVILLGRCE